MFAGKYRSLPYSGDLWVTRFNWILCRLKKLKLSLHQGFYIFETFQNRYFTYFFMKTAKGHSIKEIGGTRNIFSP
jgi:hypothetical protein